MSLKKISADLLFCLFVCSSMKDVFPKVADGTDPSVQAGRQAISLAVTLGIALLGGLIVGRCHVFLSYSDKTLTALLNRTGDLNNTELKQHIKHLFGDQKMYRFLG